MDLRAAYKYSNTSQLQSNNPQTFLHVCLKRPLIRNRRFGRELDKTTISEYLKFIEFSHVRRTLKKSRYPWRYIHLCYGFPYMSSRHCLLIRSGKANWIFSLLALCNVVCVIVLPHVLSFLSLLFHDIRFRTEKCWVCARTPAVATSAYEFLIEGIIYG